jgi:uncharacterized protein (TIGR03437 family)
VFGQAVALTAMVGPTSAPAGFALPTGQVTFGLEDSNPFTPPTPLGTVALASGSATLRSNNLPLGQQRILVRYSGDSTWSTAQAEIVLTVLPAQTTSTVSMTLDGGKPVFNATVAAMAPAVGVPTGTVQFVDSSSKAVLAKATMSGGSTTIAAPADAPGRPIAAVYSGDANFAGSTSVALPALTNAASDQWGSAAPDEVVSLFGVTGLSGTDSAALPLSTLLGGVTVKLTDAAGGAWAAPLYNVVAPARQINLVIPAGIASGLAAVTITLPDGSTVATVARIASIAPGIFTANSNGQGVFAGQVLHTHADSTRTTVDPAVWSSGANAYVSNPIDLGPAGDRVILVLYGTGLRHAASVTATVNGVGATVLYAGPQGAYPGLDQVNDELPRSLAGAGVVNLTVSADGQPANPVVLNVQ